MKFLSSSFCLLFFGNTVLIFYFFLEFWPTSSLGIGYFVHPDALFCFMFNRIMFSLKKEAYRTVQFRILMKLSGGCLKRSRLRVDVLFLFVTIEISCCR